MDWTQTTNTIDYAIESVDGEGENTQVTLQRIGLMPMPLDIDVTYTDGSTETFYIPLQMMRWEKPAEEGSNTTVVEDWAWGFPDYQLEIPVSKDKISSIVIDDSQLLADINRDNNTWNAENENSDSTN